MKAMLLSTVLSTSGVTSSKAGTWLRELGVRAMPGDDSTKSGHKHNELLKQFGLLDKNGKPTWFTNGKPDMVKALEIAGPIAQAMPPEDRLTAEMALFGRRGGGAFGVLGNPTSISRYRDLEKGLNDPGNINRYNTILDDTMGTSKMVARTTLQEFNVSLIELGRDVLPLAISGVKGLSAALGWITGGHKTQEDKSFQPNWMERLHDYASPGNWFGRGASALPKPQNQSFTDGPMHALPMNFLQGPPQSQSRSQFSFSLNVDGQKLADTVVDKIEDKHAFATGAAAADGLHHYLGGDHGGVGQ